MTITNKEQQRWIMTAEDFVRDHIGGKQRLWQMDGPPHTLIDQMQCWSLDSGRTVILQIYKSRHGFDVFPNILLNNLDETAEVIRGLSEIEETIKANRK